MEASRSFPWVSLSFRELVRRSCFYKMLVDKRSIPGEPVKRAFQQHIRAALSPPTSSPNSDSDSPPPLPPETPPPPPEKPTLPALDDAITSAESELLAGNPEKDKPWFVLSEATLVPLCARRDTAQLSYYNNRSETNRLVIPPRWTSSTRDPTSPALLPLFPSLKSVPPSNGWLTSKPRALAASPLTR
mmetsp:Transcript_27061/g.39217  ORF Transcript_27061/g.39217 Transcript_27061/m.39217 type:complete len:188 (-) Transcript_27061:111-674(-)